MAKSSETGAADASASVATPAKTTRQRMSSEAHVKAVKTMKRAKDVAAAELKTIRQQLKQDPCHSYSAMLLFREFFPCDMQRYADLSFVSSPPGKSTARQGGEESLQARCLRAPRDRGHEGDEYSWDGGAEEQLNAYRGQGHCGHDVAIFEELQQRGFHIWGSSRARCTS